MPPKHKTSPNTIERYTTKALKKSDLLSELSKEYRNLPEIKFESFVPEKDCSTKVLLPPMFPSNPIPHDYFDLLFPSDLYDIIIK